jgi:3-hydroxyisobutyrate dehydrogenase-like beta-hydroxyacid dehydrogenase
MAPRSTSSGRTWPRWTLRLDEKDERPIRTFADGLGVPAPLLEEASRRLRQTADSGHAEQDTASVGAPLSLLIRCLS